MFTGLVEEIGLVESNKISTKEARISIKRPSSFDDLRIGDSISINGTCLSVIDLNNGVMGFDVMPESLNKTNITDLKSGSKVNLERALRAGDRLGGHFVTGHIDYKAQVSSIIRKSDMVRIEISLPKEYQRYIVSKGSVTIDGVSLTVGEVLKKSFSVYLIPHTLKTTTLGLKKTQDTVNIEVDLLAKYITKSASEKQSTINTGFLKEHGFL